MVNLIVNLHDVFGALQPEDLDENPDDKVVVWAPHHRTTPDLSIVTPRKRDIRLVRGRGEREVEPGEMWVQIQCGAVEDSEPRLVTVPDRESVTLAEVLEGAFVHTPAVEYRVAQYATLAEKAARDAGVAVESTFWDGDRLSVMGEVSPPLTGPRVVMEVSASGTWVVDGVDTGHPARGAKGEPGDGDVSTQQLEAGLATKADLVGGKVPSSQIPAIALTKPHSVGTRAAMLALTAQEGDVAIITAGSDKGSYMLGTGAPTEFSSWHLLAVADDHPVSSVNGQTGTVNLGAGDVGAAPTTHSHTPQQAGAAPAEHGHDMNDVDGLDVALAGKAPSHVEVTGDWPTTGVPGVLYWKAE